MELDAAIRRAKSRAAILHSLKSVYSEETSTNVKSDNTSALSSSDGVAVAHPAKQRRVGTGISHSNAASNERKSYSGYGNDKETSKAVALIANVSKYCILYICNLRTVSLTRD